MDMSDVVELRVHGVSGTPPEDLLDRPLVIRVAGDDKAGFYRPRLAVEGRDDAAIEMPATEGPALEGYAWGGLTSGAPTRALWLLLLPFTLINVVPRMRPPAEIHLRLLWSVTRVLALSMTLLFLAGLAGVGEDLFAWQCALAPADATVADCSRATPGWIMIRLLGMSQQHRLAVGALLPLVVLVVMWQISGRTIKNYERVSAAAVRRGDEEEPRSTGGEADAVETGLRSRWMWQNEYQVRRLRQIHLQSAMAGVLWTVAAPMNSALRAVDIVVAAAVVAYGVVMLCVPSYTGRRPSRRFELVNLGVWCVLGALSALTGLRLVLAANALTAGYVAGQGLPFYADTVLVLFLVQMGLLAAFCVVIAVIRRHAVRAAVESPDAPEIGLRGWTAVVFATLGVFLGAVFAAGVYVFAAAWLYTGSLKPGFGQVSHTVALFDTPEVIKAASLAYLVSVVGLVAILVGVGARWLAWRARFTRHPDPTWAKAMADDYAAGGRSIDGPVEPSLEDVRRDRHILGVWWIAGLVDRAGVILAAVVGTGAVVSVACILLLLGQVFNWPGFAATTTWLDYQGRSLTQNGEPLRSGVIWEQAFSSRFLEASGAYFVVITLLGLVALGAAAFRVAKTRRSVGILWDLGSFWPRSAHPFAAPCYAERAVPDLTTRLYDYTARRGKGVVMSAHSQGTVISAATLEQLATIDASARPEERILPRVAFLSFGCVLRRLYARYFPAYFGARLLDDIPVVLPAGPGQLSRWRNLWRRSDYLGGPVTVDPHRSTDPPACGIDVHLVDPAYARPDGDTIFPLPGRHSNYWRDQEFQRHVRDLARGLVEPTG